MLQDYLSLADRSPTCDIATGHQVRLADRSLIPIDLFKPGRLGFELELAGIVPDDANIRVREAVLGVGLDFQRQLYLRTSRAL